MLPRPLLVWRRACVLAALFGFSLQQCATSTDQLMTSHRPGGRALQGASTPVLTELSPSSPGSVLPGRSRTRRRHSRSQAACSTAAHTWACGLVDHTLARLTAFVMSGSNMLDSRGAAVRETWGAGLRPGRLLVFSDGNGTAQSGINLAGTGSDHGGSQKKWPLAFQHYCGSPDLAGLRDSTDWLLVADDDTYIFLPNLAALLTLGFSPDWPYVLGRPWRAEGVTYPCGGPGYVLSRAAMATVCARVGEFLTSYWPSYWSDINMGGFLQALNITFVPLDGLYLRNLEAPGVKRIAPNLQDDAIIPELAVGQPLSNHWAGPDEMRRLHAVHGMGEITSACLTKSHLAAADHAPSVD